jgi:hypothetical protein
MLLDTCKPVMPSAYVLHAGGPHGLTPPSSTEIEAALLRARVVGVPGALFRTDLAAAKVRRSCTLQAAWVCRRAAELLHLWHCGGRTHLSSQSAM